MNKQPKNQAADEEDDQIDVNMKQHEVNERILVEMNHMKQEASRILFRQFLGDVETICNQNLSILRSSRNIDAYFQAVKAECYSK